MKLFLIWLSNSAILRVYFKDLIDACATNGISVSDFIQQMNEEKQDMYFRTLIRHPEPKIAEYWQTIEKKVGKLCGLYYRTYGLSCLVKNQ